MQWTSFFTGYFSIEHGFLLLRIFPLSSNNTFSPIYEEMQLNKILNGCTQMTVTVAKH